MKTTLELPDELMVEAKMVAALRRTTLKALFEHALRCEIQPETRGAVDKNDLIETGPNGTPRLKRKGAAFITSDMIRAMMESEGV
ncbi:MAG: hypothetical protein ACOYM3_09015 [Terrimicrobiaceae bacterium]